MIVPHAAMLESLSFARVYGKKYPYKLYIPSTNLLNRLIFSEIDSV